VRFLQRIVFRCIAFEIGTVNILFKDGAWAFQFSVCGWH
jgi:hypothetical protein